MPRLAKVLLVAVWSAASTAGALLAQAQSGILDGTVRDDQGSRRERLALLALFVLLVVFVAPLGAQINGRIEGRVLDPDGAALPGAAIRATSPSLQGTQQAVSDTRGEFRLLTLPPGDYVVRLELAGFQSLEQPAVRVPLDGGVVLELRLTPEFSAEITITTESPIVDARSTTTGASFPQEVLAHVPAPRSSGPAPAPGTEGYGAVALLAPGVAPGGAGYTAGPAIGGATSTENRFLVDGLDTTEQVFGSAGTSFPFELMEEVEVKTGGYGAELGGALAGVVNVLTRSGGNDFQGSLFAYYSNPELQAEQAGGVESYRESDYGLTLGGPIARDRLWYFVALNPQRVESDVRTVQGLETNQRWEAPRYAAKLTWQASSTQRLTATTFGLWNGVQEGREVQAAGLVGNDDRWWRPGALLAYDGSFGSNLLLEASVGRFESDFAGRPLNDAVPIYRDGTVGATWASRQGCGDAAPLAAENSVWFAPGCRGGFGVSDPDDATRDQARATLSWFRGRHELKLGGEARRVTYVNVSRNPGPFPGPLLDETGLVVTEGAVPGGFFSLEGGFYVLGISAVNRTVHTDEKALYVEDLVRIHPHLTLRLGLRADASLSTGPASGSGPYAFDFGWDEMLAPRLGLTWDLGGNGRSRLYASAGRFFESIPLLINYVALDRPSSQIYVFAYPSDGALPTYTHLGPLLADFSGYGQAEPVVPGIRPMHTDEASLGYEFEPRPGLALGIRGVYRRLRDVIEDFSVDGEFVLGNPKSYTVHPITGEPLAEPAIYPEAERNSRSLELTLNRRLRGRWQLFASYVYSEVEGNYDGLGGAAHWTGQFDYPWSMVGAWGPLANDRPHQVKVYGSYEWPFRLITGFAGSYFSGTPISKLGYGEDFFCCRFVEPRGAGGRTPDLWKIDLQLDYPLRLRGDNLTLDLFLDVFNLTNRQVATSVDDLWTYESGDGLTPDQCGGPGSGPGTACPDGNPNWGSPLTYQQGRIARLGVKLRW